MISPSSITTINTGSDYRGEYIRFRTTLIQRIRNIPNDRFGIVYTDDIQAHSILHSVKDIVQSLEMYSELKDLANGYFSVSSSFIHYQTILDPIHLYPSDFLAESTVNDSKIVGYKWYSEYRSPIFRPLNNPLACSGQTVL